MKTFFKKKVQVRILGRSIPLSVVLLILITGIAAAVFGSLYVATLNISAGTGPTGIITEWECFLLSKAGVMEGSIDTCVLTDKVITISASGLDNDSAIKIHLRYSADTPQVWNFICPNPLPAGMSACLPGPINGTLFTIGGQNPIDVILEFYDLVPGQIMEEFSFSFEFTDS